MNAAAVPEPHRLKFHWPQRPGISLPLVGFLFLSLLAHGLAFYILQVVDPPVAAITPPPVQVNWLTPSTPEKQAILRWIDAEDPAMFANPHEIIPGNLYELPYQRSTTEIRATPKSPGENPAAVLFPPAEDAAGVMSSAQATSPEIAQKMPPLPTTLRFSGQLAGRKILKQPPLNFDVSGAASRQPTSFMVGVGPDGKVLYTFFMGMEMGDQAKTIDQKAEDYLGSLEFSRQPGGITWGIATYYWGNDTYQPGAAKP